MSERETVGLRVEEGVGTIVFASPQSKNAITGVFAGDLMSALDELEASDARVAVIEAQGSAFCAGADLNRFLAEREKLTERVPGTEVRGWMDMMATLSELIRRLRRYRFPVIAAVNGPAMGGGANLALACDIRIAAPEARFASSFIRVGLGSAAMGGTYLWPRAIGSSRAFEALLTGRVIDADEAERIGLVSRVVPAATLADEAQALARELAQLPPLGLIATKRGLNVGMDASLEDALALEAALQAPLFMTDDHHEGMRAFAERRPPAFEGR